ncbi:phosphotransferase family protein [Sphaerisporangium aureirubrum]|uniref:Aminoglycoside phosphotransferase n=1 Tax=Sphaerisporangium aureirubrum TaxID=1544736 RepID=A0ABW1NE54_9ACTN
MATTPQWDNIPAAVRADIETHVGAIHHVTAIPAGLTAGTAARLDTPTGPVFVKALPADSPSARLYAREQHVNAALPTTVPAPRMQWGGHDHGWVTLVFDHITAHHTVSLAPDSEDLDGLLGLVATLGETLTPNPAPGVPPVADNIAFLLSRADTLLAHPPQDLQSLAAYQAARAGFHLDHLAGDTLLHADIHHANLIATAGQLHIIDWGLACQGAAWVETALLIPRLIAAGHTPQQAENLAEQIPAWKTAPEAAVTGLAAVWTLFREFVARNGPERIRESRARAAAAGRAWVEFRIHRATDLRS